MLFHTSLNPPMFAEFFFSILFLNFLFCSAMNLLAGGHSNLGNYLKSNVELLAPNPKDQFNNREVPEKVFGSRQI